MSYEDQAKDCEPKDLVVKRSVIQELHWNLDIFKMEYCEILEAW